VATLLLMLMLSGLSVAAGADPFDPVATLDAGVGSALAPGIPAPSARHTTKEKSTTPVHLRAQPISKPTLTQRLLGGLESLFEASVQEAETQKSESPEQASTPTLRFDVTLPVRKRSAKQASAGAPSRPVRRVDVLRLPGGIAPGMAFMDGTKNCVSPGDEPDEPQRRYCLDGVPWPNEISDAFNVSTSLYRGAKALVRYRDGTADAIYVLFDAAQFDRVQTFLVKRFGPPSEEIVRKVAFIGRPPAENPSAVWRKGTGAASLIMDIRGIDDERGMLPDATTGRLSLQRADAGKMFDDLDPDLISMHALRKNTAQH